MKDTSKVYFNINGFSLKNIIEIAFNKPTPKWTQDAEDIFGDHENILAPSKKAVFTITVRRGTDDDRTLKTMEISNVEGAGTYNDKSGTRVCNVTFDKAVVMNNDRTNNRTENTVQYIINASIVTEVII